MHKKSTEKLNQKKAMTALLIVLGIALVCFVGVIAAKYLSSTSFSGNQIGAKDFYFTIDTFLEDTKDENELVEKSVNLYGSGQQSYTFSVLNYYDALRVNQQDITFTTTYRASGSINASLTSNGADANGGSFQLNGEDAASHQFTVTFIDGVTDGDWVEVTVTSSAPYEKVMKLIVYYNPQEYKVLYRVEDEPGKTYSKLVVTTSVAIEKNSLTIDWSDVNATENALQIDTTDTDILLQSHIASNYQINDVTKEYMVRATNDNAITADGSISIYFFKADPSKNYSILDTEAVEISAGTYQINITQNS